MSSISESLDKLAEAIRSINPYATLGLRGVATWFDHILTTILSISSRVDTFLEKNLGECLFCFGRKLQHKGNFKCNISAVSELLRKRMGF